MYPNDTWVAKLDYVTTSSKVAPNNVPDDPISLASRIAHRRVARTKRNLNGGLFRPDPYAPRHHHDDQPQPSPSPLSRSPSRSLSLCSVRWLIAPLPPPLQVR